MECNKRRKLGLDILHGYLLNLKNVLETVILKIINYIDLTDKYYT